MNKNLECKSLSYRNNPNKLLTLYRHIKHLTNSDSEYLAKEFIKDMHFGFDKLNVTIPLIRTHLDRDNPLGYSTTAYRDFNCKRNGASSTGKTHTDGNNEKHLAMNLYKMYNPSNNSSNLLPKVGYILDYETPIGGNLTHLSRDGEAIKNPDDESKLYKPGKCDLLAYNPDDNLIYILELKDEDSTESLLSAIIEAYTYFRIIDKNDLKDNMTEIYPHLGINEKTLFVAVPLICKNNNEQFRQLNCNNIKELISSLDEHLLVYSKDSDNIDLITVEKIEI